MKFKSLVLMSLAAITMVSCSKEMEGIGDNGNDVAKDAVLNFGITFPTGSSTRATDDETGLSVESKVHNITLVLTYTGGIPTFTKTYPADAFTVENNNYKLTVPEMVAPGRATATIYVNNEGVPSGNLSSISEFNLGNYAATTGEGNFFMSGKSQEFDIVANADEKVNSVSVSVDRVAAKLNEVTAQEDYTFDLTASSVTNVTISVKLTDYTFSNLNKRSYPLSEIETYFKTGDFWNEFTPNYEEDLWGMFTATKSMTGTDKTTYCFENNNSNAVTTVYYKAVTMVDNEEITTNFYVYKNILYKSFTELDAVFNGSLNASFGLSDHSTNADFMTKIGAKKYTDGICYYSAAITTNGGGNILRNNVYLLNVNSIKDLGFPEIDVPTPGDPTLLGFDVTVKNWTVNTNSFDL